MVSPDTIQTILIANRGEIARRIIRTCRRMGIRTVAVYSDADATSLHVAEADTAARIGPPPAADSYLNIPAIIDASRRTGANAIHPGFGFLAENAEFASACAAAGYAFIGPPAEAIAAMGDKRAARDLAERCGVPVIPGYDGGDQSALAFHRAAEQLGFPIMVKAAAGGGGKGMRLVREPGPLAEALASARHEAAAAFGSGDLLLERALERPRHVEIQILGDAHGRILHLGERECSIQRRHQKVIEESPSPAMTPALRAQMGAAAIALATAIDYTNAGTVEFLLDGDRFYFLEMNTRLQVEHPVTELITGIDLVEWQIRVARCEALPWAQADIHWHGHAIEARLYAEDPAGDFLPASGPVLLWRPPGGEKVRIDDGIRDGDEVSAYYDPMLAKIIAHGDSREVAIHHLRRALHSAVLLGLPNNLAYLRQVLDQPAFLAGELSTSFLDEHPPRPSLTPADETAVLVAAGLARWRQDESNGPGYWRNNPTTPAPYRFRLGDRDVTVSLRPAPSVAQQFTSRIDLGDPMVVTLERLDGPDMTLTIDGHRHDVVLASRDNTWWVQALTGAVRLVADPLLPEPHRSAGAGGSLRAPMPGRVLAVLVEVGQIVAEGQPLLKLEAMKMEHTIRTAAAGIVEAIYFSEGEQVGADELLVRVVES